MKWVECIKIQTTRSNIAAKMLSFVAECEKCHGLLKAKVFNHASINDCSLCLMWDTDRPEPHGSSVGLHLCSTLKKYGLVDHSVWVEKNGKGRKSHEQE